MSSGRPPWTCGVPPFGNADTQASEHRVAALAYARLRQSPYPPLHGIACRFCNGVLTLSGRVPNYYLKQIAQSLVLSVEGVAQIHNNLDTPARPG